MTELTHIYRQRRYSLHGHWKAWYEQCPIVHATKKYFVVESQNFPDSPLYPGGKFHVDRLAIASEGKAYHSRHGEWFFVEPQSDSFLFPSKAVLSIFDYATVEAQTIGWDVAIPVHEWQDWQRHC